jgi:hypothetical protein
MTNPKRIGKWELEEGMLTYEARVYTDGCELAVISYEDAEEDNEIVLACGLAEMDRVIAILTSAREKFAALPKKQQGSPEPIADPEDPEDEEEDPAEATE